MVNGRIPDTMPSQVSIRDRIGWFLKFSTFDSGDWDDYCASIKKDNGATSLKCNE